MPSRIRATACLPENQAQPSKLSKQLDYETRLWSGVDKVVAERHAKLVLGSFNNVNFKFVFLHSQTL